MSKLKFIPLGGLGEVGKNMFLIEGEGEVLIFDCGVGFPEEYLKGIDLLIPDFGYLESIKEKKFILIATHGHEDHIGAIPFLLNHYKVDIYASPLTCAFIDSSLNKYEKSHSQLFILKLINF